MPTKSEWVWRRRQDKMRIVFNHINTCLCFSPLTNCIVRIAFVSFDPSLGQISAYTKRKIKKRQQQCTEACSSSMQTSNYDLMMISIHVRNVILVIYDRESAALYANLQQCAHDHKLAVDRWTNGAVSSTNKKEFDVFFWFDRKTNRERRRRRNVYVNIFDFFIANARDLSLPLRFRSMKSSKTEGNTRSIAEKTKEKIS